MAPPEVKRESSASAVTLLRASQMPEFDANSHKWQEWNERLEIHFAEIDCIEEAAQKATLLKSINAESYSLLRALCDPDLPVKKSYKQLCDMMNTHYSPPTIIFRERHNFYAATKSAEENVTAWYARVKQLALKCKFGHLDDSVRDKFIDGLSNDEKIFDKLCEENETLTLADALKKALIQESKVKAKSPQNSDVNFIRTGKPNNRNSNNNDRNNSNNNKDRKKQPCKHCGWRTHEAATCKFKKHTCNTCSRVGHLATVCRSKDKNKNNNSINSIQSNISCHNCNDFSPISQGFSSGFADDGEAKDRFHVYNVTGRGTASKSFELDVKIDGILFKGKCDTGAPCSLISYKDFIQFFDRKLLKPSHRPFFDYGGNSIKIVGEFFASVNYRDQTKTICLIVTDTDRPILLGEDFLHSFRFKLMQVNNIVTQSYNQFLLSIKAEFSDVFKSELGRYSGEKVHLSIIDGVKPVFFKPRPVPLAWKSKIETQIKDLVAKDVLEQVDNADWGTPLVPIVKPSGDLRLCGDYKVTINKHLFDFKYPLPRIEEVFAALQGGTLFSKLDLNNAYNQFVLDDESQKLCTWSTHLGVFKMKRLPFGVKTAGAIFQKAIENLLRGIPNCINFMDDICVTGPDVQSHMQTLKAVLTKLQSVGLRLNPDKCTFFRDRISYLGFDIDKNGLAKSKRNIESVLNAPTPTNVSEVRAIIGLVNFNSKFIPNFAKKMEPFYNLLRKGVKFHWSDSCQRAYEQLKKEITSDQVLVHFDPNKPIVLTTDACNTAIAGVLSHRFSDGSLRPIAFVSRALNRAERNYSTIQKEALAIVFSVTKLHQFLIGVKFELHTDHKPLLSIFGENKGLPLMAAARIQRWAYILSGFDYTIKYVKGLLNHADSLSRFPQPEPIETSTDATYINFIDMNSYVQLNYQNIAIETRRDPILSKLLNAIQEGTVKNLKGDDFKPYFSRSEELSVESGCILWGYRTIIPTKQRKVILQDLHRSHFGIVKTKALARSYLWWPKLDSDIETMIKNCLPCKLTQTSPEKSALISWRPTQKAWSRIHFDYLGPIKGFYFLIIIDSFSKWPEIFKTKSTTASFTVNKFREIFSRFGMADVIVSDNGTQFTAELFCNFMKMNRIQHILIAPGHPASNGQAENTVKTIKKSIYANLKDEKPDDFDVIVARFLFDYRNTKHCTTGETPAKIMFGRELKTRFSLLKPPTTQEKIVHSQEKAILNAKGHRDVRFQAGQNVFVRDYTDPNKAAWQPAVIDKCFGPRNYSCILSKSNRTIKRHLDQIRTGIQENDDSVSTNVDGETDSEHSHLVKATPHNNRTNVSSSSNEASNELEPIEISSDDEQLLLSAKSGTSENVETTTTTNRSLESTPKAARRSILDPFRKLF